MFERILVCGGRDFNNRYVVMKTLDDIPGETGLPILAVIQGGANGADRFAREWAYVCDCECLTFHADWEAHGKAAGPMRNQRMLDEGKPDLVVAFPGGRGTADMVHRARAAGVEVREITHLSIGGDQ